MRAPINRVGGSAGELAGESHQQPTSKFAGQSTPADDQNAE
jgi:hypothetical protein